MKDFKANIQNAFAWQFYNIRNREDPDMVDDFNLGIDKSNREEFLEKIELLTRENVDILMAIPLKETPVKSPHHLDSKNEYYHSPKFSFENLFIKRIEKGKEIEVIGKDLVLKFGEKEIFEFFTKMYVNFEIYATDYDNIVLMNDQNGNQIRLVIWGVSHGLPIYY